MNPVQLSELLTPESIRIDVDAVDWRDAITQAGDLLQQAGVCGPGYTDAMIGNVNENGPYIVVAPGFAFAHARATTDVNRTGMAWLRLSRPVEFGHESNDPVTLVAALAAVDSSAHVDAMRQLAVLLADPDRRHRLNSADTPQSLYAVLTDLTPARQEAARPADTGTEADGRHRHQTKDRILTVCGNGVGTSLFLKSTLEKVLGQWGWSRYLEVEATDTVSARGKAKDADIIFTSGEIARTLGDVGIPVRVIRDFSSAAEIDAALRESSHV